MKKKSLSPSTRQELQLAGARKSEIGPLLSIVADLRHLPDAISPKNTSKKLQFPVARAAFAGLVFAALMVAFSRVVLPGAVLYPIQKTTDGVIVAIHPKYRETVMMKRAQQVKQLVANKSGSNAVLAALTDYQHEVAIYKNDAAHYDILEACKSRLQQAANMATGVERKAITDAISSLETT